MADPLSPIASIIAVLSLSQAVLSACTAYVGKVKDAASDINRVINQIGFLTILLPRLKSLTERYGAGAFPETIRCLLGDHGPLAICTRSLKELESKLPKEPVNLRQKLQWPFESRKINEIMDRIMEQVPLVQAALVENIHTMAWTAQDALDHAKRREEREKALDWLRCADPTVRHLESRRLHQPGSNHWVLESEQFKEWKDNSGQILWLHGIPGAGKTSMPSSLPFIARLN